MQAFLDRMAGVAWHVHLGSTSLAVDLQHVRIALDFPLLFPVAANAHVLLDTLVPMVVDQGVLLAMLGSTNPPRDRLFAFRVRSSPGQSERR